MKRRFSMGQALGAPFSILKRRPGTVFVWGLAHLIFSSLMLAALWPLLGQMMGDMTALSASGADIPPDFTSDMMRFQGIAQALNLVQLLFGIVIFNAAMRATWAGKRGDRFAFMRLGIDEFRVFVVVFAMFVGFYFGVIVLALIGAGIGFAAFSMGDQVGILVTMGYGVLAMLIAFWACARFILVLPVSVIDKTFAFGSGWTLGQGQALKLAATGAVSWLFLMLIQFVFIGLIAAAAFGIAAAYGITLTELNWLGTDAMPLSAGEIAAQLQPFWPLLIFVVPGLFLAGFAQAMFAAPLASAARQLLDSGTPRPDPAQDQAPGPYDSGLDPIAAAPAGVAPDGHASDPVQPSEHSADPRQVHESERSQDASDHGPHDDRHAEDIDPVPEPKQGDGH